MYGGSTGLHLSLAHVRTQYCDYSYPSCSYLQMFHPIKSTRIGPEVFIKLAPINYILVAILEVCCLSPQRVNRGARSLPNVQLLRHQVAAAVLLLIML